MSQKGSAAAAGVEDAVTQGVITGSSPADATAPVANMAADGCSTTFGDLLGKWGCWGCFRIWVLLPWLAFFAGQRVGSCRAGALHLNGGLPRCCCTLSYGVSLWLGIACAWLVHPCGWGC